MPQAPKDDFSLGCLVSGASARGGVRNAKSALHADATFARNLNTIPTFDELSGMESAARAPHDRRVTPKALSLQSSSRPGERPLGVWDRRLAAS